MTRKAIKTKNADIVKYWFFERMIEESGLSVDASEAHERCWRCGCKKNLERCHIIPHSLGGTDEPSNLVLLCKRCHIDNPNITDPEIMWDWIRAYAVSFYDTFWDYLGMKEYEFIYHKSFVSELIDLEITDVHEANKLIKNLMPKIIKEVGHHYGHPYMNMATMAGVYRILLKRIAKKYGKTIEPVNYFIPRRPWWMGNKES